MPPILVLILGHSFICRVHDFLRRNFNTHIAKKLSLDGDLLTRWHGIGGRTVSKTREYDLGVVKEFAPNVVIMQLGTNDLTTISAFEICVVVNRRAFCTRMRQYGLLKGHRGIFCELFTFTTSICRLFSGAE